MKPNPKLTSPASAWVALAGRLAKKRTLTRMVLVPAVVLLGLAAVPGRSAAIPPDPVFPNVTGFWSGDFASVSGATGFATLDMAFQENRRFAGTFVFHPSDPSIPSDPHFLLGTVSRSGRISLVGRNESGMLVAHGEVQLGVMQLDYLWHRDDGSSDTGRS